MGSGGTPTTVGDLFMNLAELLSREHSGFLSGADRLLAAHGARVVAGTMTADEFEARKHDLLKKLAKRPSHHEMVGKKLMRGASSADPKVRALQDVVLWHHNVDLLNRRLRDRATWHELVRRGIIPPDEAWQQHLSQAVERGDVAAAQASWKLLKASLWPGADETPTPDAATGGGGGGGAAPGAEPLSAHAHASHGGTLSGGGGDAAPPASHVRRVSKGREAALATLQRKLSHRPSLQQLLQTNVIKDIMLWTRIEMADARLPAPRNCHTLTAVGGCLYLLGGYGLAEGSMTPSVLDLHASQWLSPEVHPAPSGFPQARYAHAAAALQHDVFVFGGYGASSWLNDVWMLDTEACAATGGGAPLLTWRTPAVRGQPPAPRAAHTAVVLPQSSDVLVYGGNDGTGVFADLWRANCSRASLVWLRPAVSGSLPPARSGHTAVMTDAGMLVFGGGEGWGAKCFNDVWLLEPREGGAFHWTAPACSGTPPSPRLGHGACMVGASMLLFGGGDSRRSFNDLFVLRADSWTWSRPSDTGAIPRPRSGFTATTVGTYMLLFGGGTLEGTCLNDMYVLDTNFSLYSARGGGGGGGGVGGGGGADEEAAPLYAGDSARLLPSDMSSHIRILPPPPLPLPDVTERSAAAGGGARAAPPPQLSVTTAALAPGGSGSSSSSSARAATTPPATAAGMHSPVASRGTLSLGAPQTGASASSPLHSRAGSVSSPSAVASRALKRVGFEMRATSTGMLSSALHGGGNASASVSASGSGHHTPGASRCSSPSSASATSHGTLDDARLDALHERASGSPSSISSFTTAGTAATAGYGAGGVRAGLHSTASLVRPGAAGRGGAQDAHASSTHFVLPPVSVPSRVGGGAPEAARGSAGGATTAAPLDVARRLADLQQFILDQRRQDHDTFARLQAELLHWKQRRDMETALLLNALSEALRAPEPDAHERGDSSAAANPQ